MSGIQDKVIAITGASSGMGEATALLLAAQGARVVLGARREDRLAALAARIAGSGGAVAHAVTDVTRREDLEALTALAAERFGRLDVLVASAGVGPISPLDERRMDDWDAMLDVNVRGVLHGIAAALPLFRAQGSGQFVTVASTAGLKVVPGMAVYAASKVAVRAICEGLRQEAGPDLRVTLVTPGMTATEFADTIPEGALKAQLTATLGAIAMPADAVARAIAYAIEQPAGVDVGEIVIRPTAQA